MNDISYKSPLYIQLREVIRNKIEEGEYAPGTAIPSENQLMETYGLNRIAVRSALSALEYEGLLKSVQGKGVFVLGDNKKARDLETLGGYSPNNDESKGITRRNIVKAVRKAGPFYAKILGIDPEDYVWFLRSVESIDEEPMCLEEIYIPVNILPKLDEIDTQLFSIFKIFKWKGMAPHKGEQVLRISHLDAAQAKLIGISETQAVMERTSVLRDGNNHVFSFQRNYFRNDMASFSVHYSKR